MHLKYLKDPVLKMIIYCGVAGAHLANSSHFNGRPSSFLVVEIRIRGLGKRGETESRVKLILAD